MRVDLRADKNVMFTICTLKAGCKCITCNWQGRRTVKIWDNLGRRIDGPTVNSKIKGKESILSCPNCDHDKVVFTHLIGY